MSQWFGRTRRRGVAAILIVIMLPVLLGFAALAIDLGRMRVVRAELQNAADAGALAGVQDLRAGPSAILAARTAALDYVSRNPVLSDFVSAQGDQTNVEFGELRTSFERVGLTFAPGGKLDAIRVTVRYEQQFAFARLLGFESKVVSAVAVAGLVHRPPIAFWRLNEMVGIHAADEMGTSDGEYINDVSLGQDGVIASDAAVGFYDDDHDGDDDDHDRDRDDRDHGSRVVICHNAGGSPRNAHTIAVAQPAVAAHLAHGDSLGPCPGADGDYDGDDDDHDDHDSYGFVEIPHSDRFLLDDGAVILWFNTDDATLTQGIFSKDSRGYDSGGHLDIRIRHRRVEAIIQSTYASYRLRSSRIENGQWYHVVVSFGSGGFRLFVNGEQAGSDPYTGGLGTTSGGSGNYEPITIGVSQRRSGELTTDDWQHPFTGRIDEVAIYDRGTYEPEILWLFNAVLNETVDVGAVVRDGYLRL